MAIKINGVTVAGLGAPGKDGKSPYQVAVENGYTGTETDFNNALANLGDIGSILDSINGEVI